MFVSHDSNWYILQNAHTFSSKDRKMTIITGNQWVDKMFEFWVDHYRPTYPASLCESLWTSISKLNTFLLLYHTLNFLLWSVLSESSCVSCLMAEIKNLNSRLQQLLNLPPESYSGWLSYICSYLGPSKAKSLLWSCFTFPQNILAFFFPVKFPQIPSDLFYSNMIVCGDGSCPLGLWIESP